MEIDKAYKKLLAKYPFYGLFGLGLPRIVTKSIDTLCVRQRGTSCALCINPDFWNTLSDEECVALLTHELSHIAFKHMFMASSFADSKLFNIAADAEVNSYIENLPKGAINKDWVKKVTGNKVTEGMGTKKYYEILQNYLNQQKQENQNNTEENKNSNSEEDNQEEENQPSSSQEEKDENDNTEFDNEEKEDSNEDVESSYPSELNNFDSYDSHDEWKDFKDLTESEKQLISDSIDHALKSTAEQVEKSNGYIPGELVEIIDKLKTKKPRIFDWKSYFRRLLGTIYDINIKISRRKPSERFEGSAGIKHCKKVSILVAVDTSGSVDEKELKEFFSEIDYVYKAGARVTILQCDAVITSIEEYDGKNIPEVKGRGGTSFYPPIDYYLKHKKDYASLIYFTDGYACIPFIRPSNVVWVITSNGYHQDYFGKVIYIPEKKE